MPMTSAPWELRDYRERHAAGALAAVRERLPYFDAAAEAPGAAGTAEFPEAARARAAGYDTVVIGLGEAAATAPGPFAERRLTAMAAAPG